MKTNKLSAVPLLAAMGLCTLFGSVALADTSADAPPAGQMEMQLPPGWTMEDMQAMMAAATPGKMHEHLTNDVGTWKTESTMWMFPGAEPMTTTGTSKVSSLMDGRFVMIEMTGDIPGMGPYSGLAISGFDNVSQQFVSTWIDTMGTGIANGTGELSADGKTLTWNYTYNCPLTKKPVVLREIDTITGPGTKTLVMYGADPKSGQEFKMMEIKISKE